MKKTLFLPLMLVFQVAFGQWNAIGWNPFTLRSTSGDSTFVLSAPSRVDLQKGTASWVPASGASYLVYTALLFQSGTDAPIVTVFDNTLGGTVVWTHHSTGILKGTLSGAFPAAKTHITLSNSVYYNGSDGIYASSIPDDEGSGDFIYVFINKMSDGAGIDGGISSNGLYIRIEVYP